MCFGYFLVLEYSVGNLLFLMILVRIAYHVFARMDKLQAATVVIHFQTPPLLIYRNFQVPHRALGGFILTKTSSLLAKEARRDRDIQKATQNFTTMLGQGSFGPVYKAKLPTGDVVAIKVLASDSKQGEEEFQTEVSLLGRLRHRNLVNLVGYCVDKGQHMLIYEYMSNGSLQKLLHGDGEETLSWNERLQIALDISHGIEYLHEGAVPPVVHRDLKSANILLDDSMRAKVADFGLSKEEHFDGRKSTLKGTYGYMDPSYISTNKFSVKSDVYSFGVIIFELITAIPAHQNLLDYVDLAGMDPDSVDEILDKRLVGKCNPARVRELAKIAYKCLHKTPRKRPAIGEVSRAIAKITQRRLAKEDTMSFVAVDMSQVVSRIEHQQVELNKMVSRNYDQQ
ncbi:Calcium/calmodulin-regulated receptor-like kinase 2-like protein [Drosera capensis]